MPQDHRGQAVEPTKSARLDQLPALPRLGCRVAYDRLLPRFQVANRILTLSAREHMQTRRFERLAVLVHALDGQMRRYLGVAVLRLAR